MINYLYIIYYVYNVQYINIVYVIIYICILDIIYNMYKHLWRLGNCGESLLSHPGTNHNEETVEIYWALSDLTIRVWKPSEPPMAIQSGSPLGTAVICIHIYIYQYLVGGLEHVLFFHILGISSSQLTKSIIFQRGRSTTNQICMVSFCSPEVGNPSQGTNRCASASRIERGLAHAGARPLLPVSTRQLNFGCLFQVVF